MQVVSDSAVRVELGTPDPIMMPEFAMSSFNLTVAENAETDNIVGEPVRIAREEDDEAVYKYDLDATVTNDNAYFYIATTTGQIRVGSVPFPNPVPAAVIDNTGDGTDPVTTDPTLDYEGVNSFTVIVTATDMLNGSRTAMATVNINLENLNETPYFDKDSRVRADSDSDGVPGEDDAIEYRESRTNAVVPLAAVEPDGGTLRWEVTGPDADDFMVVDAQDINDGKDRVELRFRSQPDFESPTSRACDEDNTDGIVDNEGAGNNTYCVTVRATEMSAIGGGPAMAAELEVRVDVVNAVEQGSVSMTLLQPEVETPIEAMVSDLDGEVAAESCLDVV